MDKRSLYRTCALGCGAMLALYNIFDLDIGGFVFGIAFVTLGFAVASYVTPPEDRDTPEE